MNTKHPVALIILDGFGMRWQEEGNAIAIAKKPNFDHFCNYFPKTTLAHSGIAVGLPKEIVGNSEVGHKSIGSGRISDQTMYEIQKAIDYGQFFQNEAFLASIKNAKEKETGLHIVGLISDGGAHSHIDHLFGIFRFLIENGFKKNIHLHFFTDGRDVPPKSAMKYIKMVERTIEESGLNAHIASIGGRYYGMDRGENWDRVEKSYNSMIGQTKNRIKESEIEKYINSSYENGVTDEFLEPATITDESGSPLGPIMSGDSIIFFNFRPDRMKEILQCFFEKDFDGFSRKKVDGIYTTYLKDLQITSLTQYETGSKEKRVSVAFEEKRLENTLAEVLSKKGFSQLHIAEKEKEAHITYFLNGGHEEPFIGEDRVIIPSPKVKTYDLAPAMSSHEIADVLIENLKAKKYDFYAVNFANTDMVGHTGNLEAAIKAVEETDRELGRIYEEIERQDGFMIIISDHGNIEEMINPETGEIDTEHNTSPSPFLLISPSLKREDPSPIPIDEMAKNPSGTLADVMPTILELYEIPMPEIDVPPERKGESLVGRLK